MATEQSGRRLKSANYVLIYAYATAHLLLAYYVLLQPPLPQDVDWKFVAAALGGASVASVFAILLVEVVGGEGKSRLVELRWADPLPGCQAFTVYIHEDPRINSGRLNARHGPFPTKPRDQNSLWYQLLRLNREQEEVTHAHGRSLLMRDLTWVALVIFAAASIASIRAPAALPATLALLAVFGVEFFVIRLMAKRASRDLVKTVLAVESTREAAE